jgi:malate dehydrogenase
LIDKKVGIIGVGNVGSTIASSLARNNQCNEILLNDVREDFVQAMALDISQASKVNSSKTQIKAISDLKDMKSCNIIVITAGIARKPGMSRDDLLLTNAKIMKSIVEQIKDNNKDAVYVIVSNPLDAMVYTAFKALDIPRNRVIGMAGILDSSRMAHFISEKLENKDLEIKAAVMGGHGDEMIPLVNHTTVNNKPLSDFLNDEQIEDIINKTKFGGVQIVELLKTGSAYYAPAFSTTLMVEAILNDTKETYPCAVLLDGEYGYRDVVAGVPMKLGKNGCEEIIELDLDSKQILAFKKSIDSVKELIQTIEGK